MSLTVPLDVLQKIVDNVWYVTVALEQGSPSHYSCQNRYKNNFCTYYRTMLPFLEAFPELEESMKRSDSLLCMCIYYFLWSGVFQKSRIYHKYLGRGGVKYWNLFDHFGIESRRSLSRLDDVTRTGEMTKFSVQWIDRFYNMMFPYPACNFKNTFLFKWLYQVRIELKRRHLCDGDNNFEPIRQFKREVRRDMWMILDEDANDIEMRLFASFRYMLQHISTTTEFRTHGMESDERAILMETLDAWCHSVARFPQY